MHLVFFMQIRSVNCTLQVLTVIFLSLCLETHMSTLRLSTLNTEGNSIKMYKMSQQITSKFYC